MIQPPYHNIIGEKIKIIPLHNHSANHNKLYVVRIDKVGDKFKVVCSWGAVGRTFSEQPKGQYSNLTFAESQAIKIARVKMKGGYVHINSKQYSGGMSEEYVLTQIDTSRLVGLIEEEPKPNEIKTTTTKKTTKKKLIPKSARCSRVQRAVSV